MSHIYGLAMPLLKHGIPVAPVQLENVTAPHYLDGFKVLLLTYQGMKPQSPEVHAPLANWVKRGGVLVFCDDDSDVFNAVHEWWNTGEHHFHTPREPLFAQLGFDPAKAVAAAGTAAATSSETSWKFGRGRVIWLRENPVQLAASAAGAEQMVALAQQAAKFAKLKWRETSSLVLRRGPYVIAAGLDESIAGPPRTLHGHFVNLFDPELRVQAQVELTPGSRFFLRDLDYEHTSTPQLLASAGRALPAKSPAKSPSYWVEGAAQTSAVLLLHCAAAPLSVTLEGQPVAEVQFSAPDHLLWLRFPNEVRPRELTLRLP
jgi:hypothetical protein